jgi:glycosyltransferase involved in cell wall biosynthesis
VDTSGFSHTATRGDFYLWLGQLVPYKRPDLAIEAFNRLQLPLVVIGDGELLKELQAAARSNIRLLGRQPFQVVKDHLEHCKGLIFPGVEDFGIVPVEAMAAGAPVIAYARGGAMDTIVDGKTGILFRRQTAAELEAAVQQIECGAITFDSEILRSRSLEFDKSIFRRKIVEVISAAEMSSRPARQA